MVTVGRSEQDRQLHSLAALEVTSDKQKRGTSCAVCHAKMRDAHVLVLCYTVHLTGLECWVMIAK